MTRTGRVLALVGLTLAITLGAAIPASATFGDSATVAATVGTPTVPATTTPTVTLQCWSVQDPTTLAWTGYFRATVTWTAVAATKNHNGFAILADVGGQQTEMARTGAATLTYTGDALPQAYLTQYRPTLSLRTLTSHGWTADSARTGVLSC